MADKSWDRYELGDPERPVHVVVPVNDLRAHVIHSELCPCMPLMQEDGHLVIHNSYDGREVGEACAKALDLLGKALADHSHMWSPVECRAYEHAFHVLAMHYDVPEPGR